MSTKTKELATFLSTQKSIKEVTESEGVIFFEFYERNFKKLKVFIDTLRENSSVIYGESADDIVDSVIEYHPLKSQYFKLHLGFDDAEDILFGLRAGLKTFS